MVCSLLAPRTHWASGGLFLVGSENPLGQWWFVPNGTVGDPGGLCQAWAWWLCMRTLNYKGVIALYA